MTLLLPKEFALYSSPRGENEDLSIPICRGIYTSRDISSIINTWPCVIGGPLQPDIRQPHMQRWNILKRMRIRLRNAQINSLLHFASFTCDGASGHYLKALKTCRILLWGRYRPESISYYALVVLRIWLCPFIWTTSRQVLISVMAYLYVIYRNPRLGILSKACRYMYLPQITIGSLRCLK